MEAYAEHHHGPGTGRSHTRRPADPHTGGHAHEHGHDHTHEHGSHGNDHPHEHQHGSHSHEHGSHGHEHGSHGHGPGRERSWRGLAHRLSHLVTPHSHEAADRIDGALEASARGLRALWISLVVLGLTAAVQAVIVMLSGSVALLGDTVHNFADALTAVPIGLAFLLGRRAANRRYTYGYGRAEDLAGVAVVLAVLASSVLAAATAVDRLLHPQPVTHLWAVAGAALVGCLGNEWVARYRIRTGRAIGSAALVADGVHARTDGLTSLAVLLGAAGSALGWSLADPIVGLLITGAMLLVLRTSVREIGRRLMDAVDPALVEAAERELRTVAGVQGVGALRMRWIGHSLRAEAEVVVDGGLTVVAGHQVAEAAERALIRAVPRLLAATVHIDHPPLGVGP
ncbi:cation diffusion facilitator family transporter [Saccharothrix sp. ST-888]|uniref:cation diffusion facilitator family transporter n=1 Tax=Saccharothrix sp. ST-888 TaxID=1427391 RepID=UPI0009E4B6BE|nr:cation diffusion facilitator family transporter [Saccharothrix sp. ST-888]